MVSVSLAALRGRTVLLTGASGFLGSVVLEQLLRCQAAKVYCLVRDKKGMPAHERLCRTLASPLFHELHAQHAAATAAGAASPFHSVVAVPGDLAVPGLGLSDADADALAAEVEVVLHCAALVALDADVHRTLGCNYVGTMQLLRLAGRMRRLAALVHVSTYYVNNALPPNSVVREEPLPPLPLELGGKRLAHDELVSELLAMPAGEANLQARRLMDRLGFASTYAFGKYLTEQAVAGAAAVLPPGVGRAIVRPALIGGLAGAPAPGFVSGYAGPGGYVMAYALRFFQGIESIAYRSDAVLDLVPCDIAASLVIAAAAAAASTSNGGLTVYHAASSGSHPLAVGHAFELMRRFWCVNPPPIHLPFSRLVRLDYRQHMPTAAGIERGRRRAAAKLRLLQLVLRAAGKAKQSSLLAVGFQSFCVQNSLPFARSLVCKVDNARALAAALPPHEREAWPLVWEPTLGSWEGYAATSQSGVRRLLFHVASPSKAPGSRFVDRPAASPDMLRLNGGSANGNSKAALAVPCGKVGAAPAEDGGLSHEGTCVVCVPVLHLATN